MRSLLWTLIVILFAFWLLGFLVWHLGSIIHLAIVVAVILLVYNLLVNNQARV